MEFRIQWVNLINFELRTHADPPTHWIDLNAQGSFSLLPANVQLEMATDKLSISLDFTQMAASNLSQIPLTWHNPPEQDDIQLLQGSGLKVIPKPKTDYWQKTFRNPPAARASGHALMYKVPVDVQKYVFETTFSLDAKVIYDQAGIMVYADDKHWLKAGIEYEADGKPKMSCVVTNEASDWSYFTWSTSKGVTVRCTCVHYRQSNPNVCECLVEYKNEAGEWIFLREAPLLLSGEEQEQVQVGLMCCAPKKEGKEGMTVVFENFKLRQV